MRDESFEPHASGCHEENHRIASEAWRQCLPQLIDVRRSHHARVVPSHATQRVAHLPHTGHDIDGRVKRPIGNLGVQPLGVGAELPHPAEDGHALSSSPNGIKELDRGSH